MTHPPEWPIGEPCPVCGSPDILECELRINADKIQMAGSAASAATPPRGRPAPDGEEDPLYYLRDELRAQGQLHDEQRDQGRPR